MSDLPKGWISCKFGDIVKVINGYAFPSGDFKKEGIPLIRQSNLDGDKVNIENCVFLDKLWLTRKSEFVLKKNDLLIGMSGSIGKLCVYDLDLPGMQNQRTGKIVPVSEENIERKYISSFLMISETSLLQKGKGLGILNVSADDIESLTFPLASLSEQKRIVAKLEQLLERVDRIRKKLYRIPLILKRFRQSVLQIAFSGRLTTDWRNTNSKDVESGHTLLARIREDRIKDENSVRGKRKFGDFPKPYEPKDIELGSIPASWAWASLAEIAKIITGKTPSKKNSANWNGNIPFVMPADIAKLDECLALKEVVQTKNWVSKQGLNSVKHVDSPSVFVCCIGTLGRVGYIRTKAAFSQQLNAIIPHPDLDLEYVAFYCHTIEPILRELWPQTTYMPIVNKSLFSTIPIPIPPVQEQRIIVKILKQKLEEQQAMEKSGERGKKLVEKLSDSILAKAFRGELVPQDPNDEPASELLERIKAEREINITQDKLAKRKIATSKQTILKKKPLNFKKHIAKKCKL
jgi:type I restriction enzyme S subunit